MEAYSLDLRRRVVDAVDAGLSRLEVASRFRVSNAFIGKMLRQRRDSGNLAPKGHGGGAPRKINPPAEEHLRQAVQQTPDATLAELAETLQRHRGVQVSRQCLCAALQALGLPLKKSRCTPASGTRRG